MNAKIFSYSHSASYLKVDCVHSFMVTLVRKKFNDIRFSENIVLYTFTFKVSVSMNIETKLFRKLLRSRISFVVRLKKKELFS